MRQAAVLILLVGLVTAVSPIAQGARDQAGANVLVCVTDLQNSAIQGAKVRLINRRRAVVSEAVTDGCGHVDLRGLAPATYGVEVTATGFLSHRSRLRLRAGEYARRFVALDTGPVTEKVTVIGTSGE
jgi:hypothetical protein